MNNAQMQDWLTYHNAAYPGYLAWMRKTADDGDTTVKDRLSLWAGRVADIPLTVARLATEAMFNSGVDLTYGRHLGWICDFNSRQQPEREPWGLQCNLCNGTGIVSVRFFADRRTYGGNPLPGNIGQAACQCSEGARVNAGRTSHPDATQFERFDKTQMEVDEYTATAGRYEIADSHKAAGRLELAKQIEEFGYAPALKGQP